MSVTKHGDKRSRKRMGTSKRNTEKTFEEALIYGYRVSELNGKLKKWVTKETFFTGIPHKCLLFKNHLFVVGKGDVLITVLTVPGNLNKDIANLSKKFEKGMTYEERQSFVKNK